MVCEQSRVWYRGTAPLDNLGGQVLWALSLAQTDQDVRDQATFGEPLTEPAAGHPCQDYLGNNQGHSPPGKEMVLGRGGAELAGGLAWRAVGGLS